MKMLYSRFLKYIVLPIADKSMKTSVSYYYHQIQNMNSYSPQEINEWQNDKIRKLIAFVYNNTKYYRILFNKHGIIPEDIKTIDDLKYIPILTKKEIRNNFNDIISTNIKNIPHKKSATGGSTGDPLVYWLDHNSWSYSNANIIYNWERVGYNYGEKYIALGSTSLFVDKKSSIKHQIYYKLKNKIGLNGINMSHDVCREYADLIQKKNIQYIYGYASAIYLFAKYLVETNTQLEIYCCFTTSERLTDIYRETISKAFKCKIVDCYGAHDGGLTAFSHVEGYFEVGYNCIVRQDNPDNNGIGPALLTDLTNYAMPLINYKIGDELQIQSEKNKNYPYNGQIINKVMGRTSDVIHLENGSVLTGPGFTILFKDIPVEHYCIEKIGHNSIKCKMKKLSTFAVDHEKIIYQTLKKQMGPESKIYFEYTDEIELTKSGKRQYFKNN